MDKEKYEQLEKAAQNVLKHVKLRAMLGKSGFYKFHNSSDPVMSDDYDFSIVINDDKKAVEAITALRDALGDSDDKTERLHSQHRTGTTG